MHSKDALVSAPLGVPCPVSKPEKKCVPEFISLMISTWSWVDILLIKPPLFQNLFHW